MPENGRVSKGQVDLGRGAIWRPLLTCLGGAAIFFLLHYVVTGKEVVDWETLVGGILMHIGIAFLVATVLLLTLEFNAKQLLHREVLRFLDEVATDVYKAILERLVPPEVFSELNDILRTEVIRRDCEYMITFSHPYADMPPGYFVMRRVLTFTVENQLNKSTVFRVHSIYSGDEKSASPAWAGRRFHSRLEVEGEEIVLEEGKNLFQRNGQIVLEHPVPLEPHGRTRILLRGEEPIRIAASRNQYIQGTPVIGIRVTIDNEYPEAIASSSLQMHHPAREKMTYIQERYELNHAFFPGQGFEISWETVEPKSGSEGRPVSGGAA